MAGDYLAMLRRIGPSAARVTDKVPFNLFQLGLIHLLLPKARIIHCRRHPIDTCLSMYFTNFKEKFEFVGVKGVLAFAYRQYGRLMDHWREVLPSDRFVEVDYESLIADRQTLTRRLIAFPLNPAVGWGVRCVGWDRTTGDCGSGGVESNGRFELAAVQGMPQCFTVDAIPPRERIQLLPTLPQSGPEAGDTHRSPPMQIVFSRRPVHP